MTLDRVLDDELLALANRVEAHGAEEVSRAIERAYAAVVRQQRAQLASGDTPDSLPALREAVRGAASTPAGRIEWVALGRSMAGATTVAEARRCPTHRRSSNFR